MNNPFVATTELPPLSQPGAIRLFKIFGISVFLHWTWFVVVFYLIQIDKAAYTSIIWAVDQCLALFVIVLLHEFGHALACRSVGGQANRILLWPLGGLAYVSPPQRPAAVLWSIAAGPLVNVALIPVTYLVWQSTGAYSPDSLAFQSIHHTDLQYFTFRIMETNLVLLIFNMLPIYPLDGGQILQSLLWFVMGRARSLLVAATIGIIGTIGGMIAIYTLGGWNTWMTVMAIFAITAAWNGIQIARRMLQSERAVTQHMTTGGNITYTP